MASPSTGPLSLRDRHIGAFDETMRLRSTSSSPFCIFSDSQTNAQSEHGSIVPAESLRRRCRLEGSHLRRTRSGYHLAPAHCERTARSRRDVTRVSEGSPSRERRIVSFCSSLKSERDQVDEIAAVYFLMPTKDNIARVAKVRPSFAFVSDPTVISRTSPTACTIRTI